MVLSGGPWFRRLRLARSTTGATSLIVFSILCLAVPWSFPFCTLLPSARTPRTLSLSRLALFLGTSFSSSTGRVGVSFRISFSISVSGGCCCFMFLLFVLAPSALCLDFCRRRLRPDRPSSLA